MMQRYNSWTTVNIDPKGYGSNYCPRIGARRYLSRHESRGARLDVRVRNDRHLTRNRVEYHDIIGTVIRNARVKEQRWLAGWEGQCGRNALNDLPPVAR